MALLLKISQRNFSPENTTVALAKSDNDIDDSDTGNVVFIWFTDDGQEKSRLAQKCVLDEVKLCEAPQKGNPDNSTPALNLKLHSVNDTVDRPLTTDDVEAFRYDPPKSAMADIGRIHRDRNKKIIGISDCAAQILDCRFNAQ